MTNPHWEEVILAFGLTWGSIGAFIALTYWRWSSLAKVKKS
jgi:hypothetical protein